MATLLSIVIGLLGPMQADPTPIPGEELPPLDDEPAALWDDPEPTSDTPLYDLDDHPSVSWDVLGGGIPDDSLLLGTSIGFSRFLELQLEGPLSDQLMIGGWVGLDFGYWRPDGADNDVSIMFGASGRLQLLHNEEWSIGVRVAPGIGLRTSTGGGFSILLPVEARALYAIAPRLLVGAAVDLPLRVGFPGLAPDFVTVPMIVGFAGEFHLMPSLALTGVLGFGPALDSRGVEPSFRATAGIGYRL